MNRSRLAAAVAVTALLGAAPLAQAAPKATKRTVTVAYQGAGTVDAPSTRISFCANGTNCVDVPTLKHENLVSITATDRTGTPTPFSVSVGEQVVPFCGKGVVKVAKGETVTLHPSVSSACAGVATQGEFRVVITGRK